MIPHPTELTALASPCVRGRASQEKESSKGTACLKVAERHARELSIFFKDLGQSSVLKSDGPYGFTYISAPLCCTEIGLNFSFIV